MSMQQNQQQLYGAPLGPLQQVVSVQNQTPSSSNTIKQFTIGNEMNGANSIHRIVQGQQSSLLQNSVSPNAYVQAYSFSRPSSRQQVPISAPIQHNLNHQENIIHHQGQQQILMSPHQQQQTFMQGPPQNQHVILQSQPQGQQVIMQGQSQPQQIMVQASQPQQIIVQQQPQQIAIQQQHPQIVMQQQPQQIIVQQQPQQNIIQQQQQQQHQQIIVQPPQQLQQIVVQQQPMTPLVQQATQIQQVPINQQVSVAPVSLDLHEEIGGIFQLANVRQELVNAPTTPIEQVQQNPQIQVNQSHFISRNVEAQNRNQQIPPSSLVARTLLGNEIHEQISYQQQPKQVVIEKVTVVRDEQEIMDFQERIEVLLDNIQELNKTIDFKEQESQTLYTKLQELEHIKRSKSLVDEENEALKLQIQEWQKRYNILELTIQDKNGLNYSLHNNNNSAQDYQKLLNTLKIKQEENEALKTTITRLELKQTNEKNLKEEIHRLNDLVDMKSNQLEDWKNKYLSQDQTYYQGTSFNPHLQLDHQISNYEISRPSNNIQEQSDTQRGRSTVQYETSALFRKRTDALSPLAIGSINGVTSYIEDLRLNKNTPISTVH